MATTAKSNLNAIEVTKVEPPCWWTGMNTPLQLMIYGKNLKGCSVRSLDDSVWVENVHFADNPSYIFLDVEIGPDAAPGEYTFELERAGKRVDFHYNIYKRRRGSAARRSITAADVIYMLVPDNLYVGSPETVRSSAETRYRIAASRYYRSIIDSLDHFVKLGVTAIWVLPFHEKNGLPESRKSMPEYKGYDDITANNPLFRDLVRHAHSKGLKVLYDGVTHHYSFSRWWIKELPFPGWVSNLLMGDFSNFRLCSAPDPHASELDYYRCIRGWEKNGSKQDDNNIIFSLTYFLQLFIWAIEWLDVDGLVVDTMPMTRKSAVAYWMKIVRTEYPRLNIIGECGEKTPSIQSYWQGGTLNSDGYNSGLPSIIDFPLQGAICKSLHETALNGKCSVEDIHFTLAQDFLYPDPYMLVTFLDNHEVPGFVECVGKDESLARIGMSLLVTMRGIPMVMCGNEFLMSSRNSPMSDFLKAVSNVDSSTYEDCTDDFMGYVARLLNWRKDSAPLHHGKTMHYAPEDNTYTFFRYTEDEAVFVLVNLSGNTKRIVWDRYVERTAGFTKGVEIITGKEVIVGDPFDLPPRSSFIFEMSEI